LFINDSMQWVGQIGSKCDDGIGCAMPADSFQTNTPPPCATGRATMALYGRDLRHEATARPLAGNTEVRPNRTPGTAFAEW
jgi:hypothetical protein